MKLKDKKKCWFWKEIVLYQMQSCACGLVYSRVSFEIYTKKSVTDLTEDAEVLSLPQLILHFPFKSHIKFLTSQLQKNTSLWQKKRSQKRIQM